MENTFEQLIAIISDDWTFSKIFYDSVHDVFINEKWHHEYLDTGKVCDGRFEISDAELWKKLVNKADENGINAFMEIRKTIPNFQENPPYLSVEDFQLKLRELCEKPYYYHMLRIGDTFIIRNEKGQNIGILAKTPYYYAYVDQGSAPKGFHSFEKALSYADTALWNYHRRRLPNPPPLEKPVPPISKKVEPVEIQKKPGLFDKLFGKK